MRLAVINLTIYGIAHAIVDAACAALVLSHYYGGRTESGYLALLIILYNVLAFAGQPIIGFVSDGLKLSYEIAVGGCLLTAAAVMLHAYPALSVVLCGVGNAMFHVGGGVTCLNLFRGKAAAPGIFVAPGALGLMIGTLLGKNGGFIAVIFMLLLVCCGGAILFVKQPHIEYSYAPKLGVEPFFVILLLLLGSISIRALIGFVAQFPWKGNIYLLVCLTLAVVLGKGLGGILADKYGWRRVVVLGLLLSAPLIALGNHPIAGIMGMFLFNLTMPVTLAAVANLLPGFPGFAFGMTTLALITGVFATYLSFIKLLFGPWMILGIILVSAAMLNKALKLYLDEENKITNKGINI